MAKRYDVCTPRPKYGEEGKSWWHRVGSAHQNDKGLITIYLDSVPVPDAARENKIVMMLFEPRERETEQTPARSAAAPKSKGSAPRRGADDDEIPF